MGAFLNEMKQRSQAGVSVLADKSDLMRWAGSTATAADVAALLNEVGIEVARAYHAQEATYDFCDLVVNDLWGVFVQSEFVAHDEHRPHLFWSVYQAFDGGEFHRLPDKSDDPVREHTDPAILKIIAEL